jgi:hypothetical protein
VGNTYEELLSLTEETQSPLVNDRSDSLVVKPKSREVSIRVSAIWADSRSFCDSRDGKLSGEPVVGLRVKLVIKLSDVGAAEDTREDCLKGAGGGCDVFAAQAGRDLGRIDGQCGHVLVSHLPVAQPKAEPETLDRGEPGTLAGGLEVGLGLSLDPTSAKGLDRSLAGSFAPVLAKTLAEDEDEDEPEALAGCNLKDLAAAEPAGLRVGEPVRIPSPGPPHGMGCTSVTFVFAVSANIS